MIPFWGWAALGTVAIAGVVYYAADGPEAVANGLYEAGEAVSNELHTFLAKGEYVPPGLSGAERNVYREALHRYKKIWGLVGRDNVPKEILDDIADAIEEGLKAVDAAESVDGPPEADESD